MIIGIKIIVVVIVIIVFITLGPFIYYVSTLFLHQPQHFHEFFWTFFLYVLKISNSSMKILSKCNWFVVCQKQSLCEKPGSQVNFFINHNIFTNFWTFVSSLSQVWKQDPYLNNLTSAWKFCQNVLLRKKFFCFDKKNQVLGNKWVSNQTKFSAIQVLT